MSEPTTTPDPVADPPAIPVPVRPATPRDVRMVRAITVAVPAVQYTENTEQELLAWLGPALIGQHAGAIVLVGGLLNTWLTLNLGDWLLLDPDGRFHVCAREVFALVWTFEGSQ